MNNDSFEFYIDKHGDKIKKVLAEKLYFSNRLMRRLEKEGNIYLNDKKANLDKSTYIDDILRVDFEDEENIYEGSNIKLDILYEDEDILGLNKPGYILVHPSKEERKDTLANGVVKYFESNDIRRKIRFVNRLDMNTSGVVLVAKNSYGQSRLMKEMKKNNIVKKYLAIVEGHFEKSGGEITKSIGLPSGESIKRKVMDSGNFCKSKYKVVEELKNNLSLVEVELETGRTHQIRVHMAYLNHPVLGDELYGKKSKLVDRQALHCKEMTFQSTRNKGIVSVKAPLPEDLEKILEGNR